MKIMNNSTVQEKFNQTPEEIQDIIMSVETSNLLLDIEKKYDVYKEEKNGLRILPKETTNVLIGITHPKDFVFVLAKELDISSEKAWEVAREVDQRIFAQAGYLLAELRKEFAL